MYVQLTGGCASPSACQIHRCRCWCCNTRLLQTAVRSRPATLQGSASCWTLQQAAVEGVLQQPADDSQHTSPHTQSAHTCLAAAGFSDNAHTHRVTQHKPHKLLLQSRSVPCFLSATPRLKRYQSGCYQDQADTVNNMCTYLPPASPCCRAAPTTYAQQCVQVIVKSC